jgi:septum formation protein
MEVILASQSPRRKELMGLFHIPFTIRISDADETMDPGLSAAEAVAVVSRRKAEAVSRGSNDVVIAADTIVVCNGEILGKPKDAADARRMLRLLSGRDHQVMTGMTVLRGDVCASCTEITDIHFRELSDREIDAYIRTGEPMDKAGSYGIQGGAALFAERLVGDYYNVMGLPVCRLGQLLREIAPEIMEESE